MPKATCPSDSAHKTFTTVASVMEEWKVDENGEWIETTQSLQVNHGPCEGNIWTCCTCGTEAEVE